MYVLGCDVGWKNLALCLCRVDEEGEIEADDFALLDLNNLACGADCRLPHSSHAVHKCAHVFHMCAHLFDRADKVMIEKQPTLVGSMLHIEALLYDRLQDRAELVPPQTLHRHFDLVKNDYDARKDMVDSLASPHLEHLPGYKGLKRKHDVGDAYLMCRLYADRVRCRVAAARKTQKIAVDLARFRYTGPSTISA